MPTASTGQNLTDLRSHPHEENGYVNPSRLLTSSSTIVHPHALPINSSSELGYQALQYETGLKSDNCDNTGSSLAVDTLVQEYEVPFIQHTLYSAPNMTHNFSGLIPNHPPRTLSLFDRVTLEEIQSSINTLTGDVTRIMESQCCPIGSIAQLMRLQTLALESQQNSEALFDSLTSEFNQDNAHANLVGLMSKLTSVKTQSTLIYVELQNPRDKWRSSRFKQIGDQASKIYEMTRQLRFNLNHKGQ